MALARYAGIWYEIASFPPSFQRGCVATTATYTIPGRRRHRRS
ncbi:MAG: lipocalin family protein [Holophagales bacterium]|nr:lipocalin family protein [Holophagales bacterium]